ncbi:MAG: cation transporter [Actinomycetota bacterium]
MLLGQKEGAGLVPPSRAALLGRRARRLEYLTIAWMVVEASVSIAAGIAAASIALVGFGLDSLIEIFAAGVVLWQMDGLGERRERTALRHIAGSFFLLGLYIGVTSTRDLLAAARPGHSLPGMAVTVAALMVMPSLGWAKRRTALGLGNEALAAESSQSYLCAALSATTLIGLVANATLGWWWADPAAALVVTVLLLREGRGAWKGNTCCGGCPR